MKTGIIPSKVNIVYCLKKQYSNQAFNEEGFPVRACEENNYDSLNRIVVFNKSRKTLGSNSSGYPIIINLTDNLPLSDLKIVKIFNESNRTYFFLKDSRNYIFQVDVKYLEGSLLNFGIQPGGIIQDSFVWARYNSDMTLISTNSDIYRELINDDSLIAKKLSSKELKIGGVYQDKRKETYVYLGRANSISMEEIRTERSWGYLAPSKYKMSFKKIKNLYVFCPVESKSIYSSFEKRKVGYLQIKSTHPFIKQVDQISVDEDFTEIKKAAILKLSKSQTVYPYSLKTLGLIANLTPVSETPKMDPFFYTLKNVDFEQQDPPCSFPENG